MGMFHFFLTITEGVGGILAGPTQKELRIGLVHTILERWVPNALMQESSLFVFNVIKNKQWLMVEHI